MAENKKVLLLCDEKKCCPRIIFTKDEIVIEDDFGGKVRLSRQQFALFKEKIKSDL